MCSGSFRCSKPGLPLNDSSLRVKSKEDDLERDKKKDGGMNMEMVKD
jgi:hypothetical protein